MAERDNYAPWEPQILLYPAGSPDPQPCTLRGIFKGTLHVISRQPIAHFTEIRVVFGEALISGTVSYCRAKDDDFLICISVAYPPGSKRRDPRLPVNRSCKVTVLGQGRSLKLDGVIVDLSASGLGVHIPQRLEIGTMVCVQADDFVAAGHPVYCRRLEEADFAAGIEITDIVWIEKKNSVSWGQKMGNCFKRAWRAVNHKDGTPHQAHFRGTPTS